MMRRLLMGLSGLMLAASSGCAVCSSMFDYDYSAHGGRWDRGDRAYGRVGSAFQPAEVRQPADGGPELIPSGKPLVDDADSAAEGAGDGADDQPGEASETPLVPPTPDGEKRNDGPAAKPKTNGSASANGKKAKPPNTAGRPATKTGTRDSGAQWTGKASRPGAVANDVAPDSAAQSETAAADEAADAAAGESDAAANVGEGENGAADGGVPSTDAAGEVMTDDSGSDASGALLQPPANE